MSNSKLVNYTALSPNHSGKRTHSIDRITPHCVVGQCSVETLGNIFKPASKQASCNYGIGADGRVALIVDEGNRSWCSSSNSNDQRAVTIECASDSSAPYAFNSKVYNKLVELSVDICKRNGKKKLIWIADADKALAYKPKSDEMLITVHRWFANKSCPGAWLYGKMGEYAKAVTTKLKEAAQDKPEAPAVKPAAEVLYKVQVGAYKEKKNAETQLARVKKAGFSDAVVMQVDGLYKVQVGAYGVKANADSMLAKVKAKGLDAFIIAVNRNSSATAATATLQKKSNAEIAKEIFNGTCSDPRWSTWGNEPVRSQRLRAAGYDPAAVQAEVNKLF